MAKRDEIRVRLRSITMRMGADVAVAMGDHADAPVLDWLRSLAAKDNGKAVRINRDFAQRIADEINELVAAYNYHRLAVTGEDGNLYVMGTRVIGTKAMAAPEDFGPEFDDVEPPARPDRPVDVHAALAEIAHEILEALGRGRGRQPVMHPVEIAEAHDENKGRERFQMDYSEVYSGHRDKPEKVALPGALPLRADTAERLGISERAISAALPEGRALIQQLKEATPPPDAPPGGTLLARLYIEAKG